MGNRLRVLLMGKKYWATRALEHLIESNIDVVAVVARQPDKELDRARGTLFESAINRGIPVASVAELNRWMTEPETRLSGVDVGHLDLVISYLYWNLIKEPLLSRPRMGSVNFHPAPLPELRGIGGYNFAILEDMPYFGVSAHYVSPGFDTGDLIEVRRFPITAAEETAQSLERKTQPRLFSLFRDVMSRVVRDEQLPRAAQPPGGRYINRQDFEAARHVDPGDPPELIERKIRAFWYPPYPGAAVMLGGTEFTLVSPAILTVAARLEPYNQGRPRAAKSDQGTRKD